MPFCFCWMRVRGVRAREALYLSAPLLPAAGKANVGGQTTNPCTYARTHARTATIKPFRSRDATGFLVRPSCTAPRDTQNIRQEAAGYIFLTRIYFMGRMTAYKGQGDRRRRRSHLSPTSSSRDWPDFSAFSRARLRAFARHLTHTHANTQQEKKGSQKKRSTAWIRWLVVAVVAGVVVPVLFVVE